MIELIEDVKSMQEKFNTKGKLESQYMQYEREKNSILTRTETYAKWTIPLVVPTSSSTQNDEKQHDFQSIGARSVNHLANKLAFTLFAPARPFFRLEPSTDYLQEIAKKGVDKTSLMLMLSKVEAQAMRRFVTWRSRTANIFALKSLIIAGNSLLYYPEKGKVQTYNFKDYVIKRDLSGELLDLITRDKKKIATLPEHIRQEVLTERNKLGQFNKKRKDEEDCSLYTRIKFNPSDDKFYVFQAVDDIPVNESAGSYKRKELPWIPLTWDLQRGADYGTGLVEEYAGDFHALSTLTQSIVVGAAIAADIKFLVDPVGSTDYKQLNNAPTGSFVAGRAEDISVLTTEKQNDWNFVNNLIQQYEKRIGLGFLLGSAVTRDAERVTAEEIRFQAQELEVGLGGQYSRLAEELQLPTAYLLMKDIDFSIAGTDKPLEPIIVTGLESLSRNSEVDKMRLFLQDMALMATLPDAVQAYLKVPQVMAIFGAARSVDYDEFTKTVEEVQEEQQAAQQAAIAAENQAGENQAINKAKENQMSNTQ
jgi:hypothetical protein